jgi:hypothetical protein
MPVRRSRSGSTPVGQTGGLIVLLLVIGAQFYCGMSSVTANSRMIYAFSRDGAVPFSKFWHRINPRTRTPTNSIWLAAVGAFILALPYLYSAVAYAAGNVDRGHRAVRGLRAPGVPRVAPARSSRKVRGRWAAGAADRDHGDDLGDLHLDPVHAPQAQPININTFNYTPVVFLIVLGGAALWWAVSAKNWFKGPKVQGTPEELLEIERDLELAGAEA